MKSVTFDIKGIPPSYNKCFKIAYELHEVYLSQEARRFKDRVKLLLPYIEVPQTAQITIVIKYHSNWFYNNGKIKKKDIQNLDKLVIDAISNRLGIDDSHVWCNINAKVQSNEDKTEITLIY